MKAMNNRIRNNKRKEQSKKQAQIVELEAKVKNLEQRINWLSADVTKINDTLLTEVAYIS